MATSADDQVVGGLGAAVDNLNWHVANLNWRADGTRATLEKLCLELDLACIDWAEAIGPLTDEVILPVQEVMGSPKVDNQFCGPFPLLLNRQEWICIVFWFYIISKGV